MNGRPLEVRAQVAADATTGRPAMPTPGFATRMTDPDGTRAQACGRLERLFVWAHVERLAAWGCAGRLRIRHVSFFQDQETV
jgi:hypothetical protein